MSSILFHDDTPFLFDSINDGEVGSPEQRKRRILFLGGVMGTAGYLGPAYPVILDSSEEDEEEDPNP